MWIDNLIKEVGSSENLADMLICESPEWFDFSEVKEAKGRLKKLGIEYQRVFDNGYVKNYIRSPKPPKIYLSKPYSFTEDEILKKLWNELSMSDIGLLIGRTSQSVEGRARVLGLRNKKFFHSGRLSKFKDYKKYKLIA